MKGKCSKVHFGRAFPEQVPQLPTLPVEQRMFSFPHIVVSSFLWGHTAAAQYPPLALNLADLSMNQAQALSGTSVRQGLQEI